MGWAVGSTHDVAQSMLALALLALPLVLATPSSAEDARPVAIVWRSSCERSAAAAGSCSTFVMQHSGAYTFTPASGSVTSAGAATLAGSIAAGSCGGPLAFNATTGDEAGPLGEWQQLAIGAHCVSPISANAYGTPVTVLLEYYCSS